MTAARRPSLVEHGGVTDAELRVLGLDRSDVLDLSANLHPAGPDPRVIEAFRQAEVSHYPDPRGEPLRSRLAEHHRLAPEQVLLTAGAAAAIHLVTRKLLQPGDQAAIFPPTFGEYEAAIRLTGAALIEHRLQPPLFEIPVGVSPAALTMLCNPNNPTGSYLSRSEVERLMEQADGTLLLDVAYEPFVDHRWEAEDLVRDGMDVLVVHSMTKLHAIPGLRLGYVTGPVHRIAALEAAQPSWPVGAPAIAAGLEALHTDAARRQSLRSLGLARSRIRDAFEAAGVKCAPSRGNFVLAHVQDGSGFRGRLLRFGGIAVRDCASFGLPDWVRIAVPSRKDLDRVTAGLEATLGAP